MAHQIEVAPAQPPSPRVKRRAWWLPALLALALVGGVSGLIKHGTAYSAGGAESPEAAVSEAIKAIAKQDVAGLLAVMNPGEVRSLASLINVARAKASKSALVQAVGVPEPWLRISASGVRLTTETAAKNLAFVGFASGQVTATVDQPDMPSALRPQNPRVVEFGAPLAPERARSGNSPFRLSDLFRTLAVIKESGRWYISPTTTILENLRREYHLPLPSFDDPTPLGGGADTPEGVLDGLAHAMESHNVRSAAGYISDRDVPGISWYFGSFAAQLDVVLQLVSGQANQIDVTSEPMSNGLQKLVVHGFSASARTISGEGGSVRYASSCLITAAGAKPSCVDPDIQRLTGVDQFFVVVEKNGGKWQISPVATVLEYLRVYLTDGSVNAAYRYLGIPQFAPVAATLHAGSSTLVRLNEAGYAHVVVTGAPGACAVVEADAQVRPIGAATSSNATCAPGQGRGAGIVLPPSGSVDVIVENAQSPLKPATIEVRVVS